MTGAAFAVAGALIAATPTIGFGHAISAPSLTSMSSSVLLVSDSEDSGDDSAEYTFDPGTQLPLGGIAYSSHGEGHGEGHGGGHSEGAGEDDHHGGGGGFSITAYLDANQAQVLSFSSMIPAFTVFGVTVGNSSLANAYYTGIDDGTGTIVTGVDGVLAYVAAQRGVPKSGLLASAVLGVTSIIPQINLGPVPVGHGLLAGAYFNGYDSGSGNVTGVPGLISYVTDKLGLQAGAAPAASATAAASASSVVAARKAAAVAAPAAEPAAAAADNSTPGAAKADSVRNVRAVSGRAVAKAARAARAAAE